VNYPVNDIETIMRAAPVIPVLVVGLVVTKFVVLFGLGRFFRLQSSQKRFDVDAKGSRPMRHFER